MDRNRSLGGFVDVSSCHLINDNDIDIIFDAMLHGEPIEAP